MDSSIKDAVYSAGCGGVARNRCGDLVFGFTQKLDPCSVLEEELLAIYHGVMLAVSRGERMLVVDSNSQEAIQLLLDGSNPQHSSCIIERICSIVNVGCIARWSKVPRELNKVADVLAKNSLSICSSSEFYDIPPPPFYPLVSTTG